MKNSNKSLRPGSHGNPRPKAGRQWMPATDPWIGSDDSRLWCRSEQNHFDWSTPDPWMHRIQIS
jgi:hypothetical protein